MAPNTKASPRGKAGASPRAKVGASPRGKAKAKTAASKKNVVAAVDLNDFSCDRYAEEKFIDPAARGAMAEQLTLAGLYMYVSVSAASSQLRQMELGRFKLDDIIATLKAFSEEPQTATLTKDVFLFLKEFGGHVVQAAKEHAQNLLYVFRNLAELGIEHFKSIGMHLYNFIGSMPDLLASVDLPDIDWNACGNAVSEFVEATQDAVDEAGRSAFKIMQNAWEKLPTAEKNAAAGNPDSAAAVSKTLDDSSQSGNCPAGGALICSLGSIVANCSNELLEALQRAAAVCARAGREGFEALWQGLSTALENLAREGLRVLKDVQAVEVGPALAVAEESSRAVANAMAKIDVPGASRAFDAIRGSGRVVKQAGDAVTGAAALTAVGAESSMNEADAAGKRAAKMASKAALAAAEEADTKVREAALLAKEKGPEAAQEAREVAQEILAEARECAAEAAKKTAEYAAKLEEEIAAVDWEQAAKDAQHKIRIAAVVAAGKLDQMSSKADEVLDVLKERGPAWAKKASGDLKLFGSIVGQKVFEFSAKGTEKAQKALEKARNRLGEAETALAAEAKRNGEKIAQEASKFAERAQPHLEKALAVTIAIKDDMGDFLQKIDGDELEAAREAFTNQALPKLQEASSAVEKACDFLKDGGAKLMTEVGPLASAAAEAGLENTKIAGRILAQHFEKVVEEAGDKYSEVAPQIRQALLDLKERGKPLAGKTLILVKNSLKDLVGLIPEEERKTLQQGLAIAARAGIAGMHKLFDALQIVFAELERLGEEVQKLDAMPTYAEVKQAVNAGCAIAGDHFDRFEQEVLPQIRAMATLAAAAAIEQAQIAGKLLLDALRAAQLDDKALELSEECLNAVEDLKKSAAPIVNGDVLDELKGKVGDLIQSLSELDVKTLRAAVGECAAAGIQGMESLLEAICDAIQTLLPHLLEGAGVVTVVVEASFDGVSELYTACRDETGEALARLAGATAGCCQDHCVNLCGGAVDLIKFEVFRDVFQALGTFFSRLFQGVKGGVTALGVAIWGFFGSIAAIDFVTAMGKKNLIIIGIVILVAVGLVALFYFFWFLFVAVTKQQDNLRMGHEAISWRERKRTEGKNVTRMTQVLTVCLTIYLPISKLVVEILYCDYPFDFMLKEHLKEDIWQCRSGLMTGLSVFFLVFLVVPLPVLCLWLIERNKPQGSPENPHICYDEDGLEVAFTDELYHDRVENDAEQIACPYRSLYKGFERRWSGFKVAMMLFKFALICPIIFLSAKWENAEQYKTMALCEDGALKEYRLMPILAGGTSASRRLRPAPGYGTQGAEEEIFEFVNSDDQVAEFARVSPSKSTLSEGAPSQYDYEISEEDVSSRRQMLSYPLDSSYKQAAASISTKEAFANAFTAVACDGTIGSASLFAGVRDCRLVSVLDARATWSEKLADMNQYNTTEIIVHQEILLDIWDGVEPNDCMWFANTFYKVKSGPAQAGATLGVVFVFAVLSFLSTPFIDPLADYMDASGRLTMSVTCLVALLYSSLYSREADPTQAESAPSQLSKTASGGDGALGALLNGANFVNLVIMTYCIVYGFPCFRQYMKNRRNRVEFSDTCRNLRHLPHWSGVFAQWDLRREVKHRVWHAFWDSVLLNACGEEVAERMLELRDTTRSFGFEKIRAHWEGYAQEQVRSLRAHVRDNLEGVDLFWDKKDAALDGKLDSRTCFGKMYCDPYPFHMVVVYDDCEDVTFVWGDEGLQEFVELNRRPDIANRRENRQLLRGLSRSGEAVDWAFDQEETHVVQDGYNIEVVEDADGNTEERETPNMITVTVRMFYHQGRASVGANTSKVMSAGFHFSFSYHDGHGVAHLPKTGVDHEFTNMSCTKGLTHIGLDQDSFVASETFEGFAANAKGRFETDLAVIDAEAREYRKGLRTQFDAKASVLHNGFWYFVYNNQYLERASLEAYLRDTELNPVLRKFTSDHSAGLDYLYLRMGLCQRSKVNALWFVFWDDLWQENKAMRLLAPLKDDIDPTSGTSICYNLMQQRGALEQWSSKRGLEPLLHTKLLDDLYARLESETDEVLNRV